MSGRSPSELITDAIKGSEYSFNKKGERAPRWFHGFDLADLEGLRRMESILIWLNSEPKARAAYAAWVKGDQTGGAK